jgi:hypothetical protein
VMTGATSVIQCTGLAKTDGAGIFAGHLDDTYLLIRYRVSCLPRLVLRLHTASVRRRSKMP